MSEQTLQSKGQWLRTIKAVAWSFVGLRQGSELVHDSQKINPIHLVVVAIGTVCLLVIGLIFFVQWAVVAAK
jgi:amino acid transporter